jgi:hypothetical protein
MDWCHHHEEDPMWFSITSIALTEVLILTVAIRSRRQS